MDNYFEEITRTKDQLATRKKEMEAEGLEELPKLFISPIEQLMYEFKGSVKEF